MVDKGSMGHVFLQVFSFPISVTAPVLHILFHLPSADAPQTSAIDSIIEYEQNTAVSLPLPAWKVNNQTISNRQIRTDSLHN
jgi:hypothetical protein